MLSLAIYRAQGLMLERRIPLDGWVTLVDAPQNKTAPGGDDRGGFAGEAAAYQPPNGVSSIFGLTSRLPCSSNLCGSKCACLAISR